MQQIFREHPDYVAQKGLYAKYRDLYAGGEQFKANADRYLARRQREPGSVFMERLSRVFYENYVGSIIDWYATTLFRREPVLLYESAAESVRTFYNNLAEDCDLRGSGLTDFMRRQLVEVLVTGRSYLVIDFPRSLVEATNRAMEEDCGISRAYLSEYPVESLTNWSMSDTGEFDWVVLRTRRLVNTGSDGKPWEWETRWLHYDRQRFSVYRQIDDSKAGPQLIDTGTHGLSHLNRVPVVEFRVPDGLWLMNRSALLQLEHFNKSNALAWALSMGLFAMPVIYSDREWDQVIGESYFLQLGPNDKFGWTEPTGNVYGIALTNIDRLKEEIYRICYVLHQAGGSLTKNGNLTGLSKLRDYAVTQEVLRGYGDTVKDTLKKVLLLISAARQDDIRIEVSGLDEFDIGDFGSELEDARSLLTIGVESPTFRKQVLKKRALKFLCDANQHTKDQIAQEIDCQE